jgi:hypothetical protein
VGAALAQADPAVAGSTSVSPTHVSGRRVSVVAAGEARINAPFRSPRVDLISQNEPRGGCYLPLAEWVSRESVSLDNPQLQVVV